MLIPIVVTVVVLAMVGALIVWSRPNDFSVKRSIEINRSASELFEELNNLRKMNEWNPWVKADPKIQEIYEGPSSGVGAMYSWKGNSQVGEGRMTIVESKPNEFVRSQLEFIRPFPGTNDVVLSISPAGKHSVVSWSMTGTLALVPKIMGLFVSMDKMCGDGFEKGLTELKNLAEAR